jgi:hypothetical protein
MKRTLVRRAIWLELAGIVVIIIATGELLINHNLSAAILTMILGLAILITSIFIRRQPNVTKH